MHNIARTNGQSKVAPRGLIATRHFIIDAAAACWLLAGAAVESPDSKELSAGSNLLGKMPAVFPNLGEVRP
jgi:hypothetical protein